MSLPHNIFDLFERQAEKSPDAIAVIEGDGITTSYGALLQYACQVSAYCLSSGVSAEQPIGVMMSRTSKMIGVLLGILKSRAAYVSIYGDDPLERQRRYVSQAGIKMLITDQVFKHRADQLLKAARNVEITEIETIEKNQWVDSEIPSVKTSGLAYIMFTSGSTGDPKGVEVEHRNMYVVLQTTADMLHISADDCFLVASSLGFDLSVADIFLPLMCGGKILLRDKKCWTDVLQLAKDISNYGVTVVATPPSLWSIVLGSDMRFPRVRVAITCGEAAQIPIAKQLIEICEEAWNFYGPTECTVWCTAYHITREGLLEDKHSDVSISIGKPLACAQVRIADDQGHEIAHGQQGELWVTGAGLSRGYRNDPILTASKFVYVQQRYPELTSTLLSKSAEEAGESIRYYRTGDLVSQDEDGNLRYFGRIDDQLQIHGQRIEPGDIESTIREHSAVQDVAATWYDTAAGSRSIVAAIVRRDHLLTPYMLHTWLSEQLPKGMLPAHYIFLEGIPLLTSGKVDRRAIRQLIEREVDVPCTTLRKLTTTEEFVMDAWRHVLKVEAISPTDHFFTIGGDSLSAVILVTRLEAAKNVQLPDEFVYQNYTPEKMALRLDQMRVRQAKTNVHVKRRSLRVKIYGRVEHIVRRYIIKRSKHKTRTPGEILDLQRLYVSVWRGHRTTPESLVVTLNTDGKARRLFWCMQAYWELAEMANVMPDHPIHGMRSGPDVVHPRNEKELMALALHYALEIQGIQPEGSLILGGNCLGARIMHYVAEHLQSLGRKVEMLILLEHWIERKYKGRVHLIYGRESSSNPYVENSGDVDRKYHQLLPDGYAVDIVPGKYAELFRPANIQYVADILREILVEEQTGVKI